MAVETTGTSANFVGTGASASYAPGFYVNSSSQVRVFVDSVLKTLGDDYVVNGVGASAGCTIVATFPLGSAVYIERRTPITQLVDTINNETILEDVLDAAFDKLTMISQEINGKVDRAPLMPQSELGFSFPAASLRTNTVFGFDASGVASLLTITGSVVTDLGLSTYRAPGTGMVVRSGASKLDDLLSVIDAGAVGGGVIDDTAADDLALTRLKARGGGVLAYPPKVGGYKVHLGNRQPGVLFLDALFPAFAHVIAEPRGPVRAYFSEPTATTGKVGFQSLGTNGTGVVPFTMLGGGDIAAFMGWVMSGADAPNPVCVANFGSRFQALPPGINWVCELDANNESATPYTAGDPRGGWGCVINTGSTYSPDTGIVILRATGEGTGPGWKAGIRILGARDVGIVFQAMSPATYPSMSPAPSSTLTIITSSVSTDAFQRFTINESGRMDWGSGAAAQDTTLQRAFGGGLTLNKLMQATAFWVGGNQVVAGRQAAVTAPTGGVTVDTEARTAINNIINRLQLHGLIA